MSNMRAVCQLAKDDCMICTSHSNPHTHIHPHSITHSFTHLPLTHLHGTHSSTKSPTTSSSHTLITHSSRTLITYSHSTHHWLITQSHAHSLLRHFSLSLTHLATPTITHPLSWYYSLTHTTTWRVLYQLSILPADPIHRGFDILSRTLKSTCRGNILTTIQSCIELYVNKHLHVNLCHVCVKT